MAKIVKHGATTNPMVVVAEDEVLAFLRGKADELGLAGHQSLAVQVAIRNLPDGQDDVLLMAVPELVLMVSNRADP